jgi:hypothetical protein
MINKFILEEMGEEMGGIKVWLMRDIRLKRFFIQFYGACERTKLNFYVLHPTWIKSIN